MLRGRWLHRFGVQCRYNLVVTRRRLRDATPFGHLRLALTTILLVCGLSLLAVLVVPQYDRALVLSGRTEVLSMRLDDPAFGSLDFRSAVYKANPDQPAQTGAIQLDISPGATVRIERLGRAAVRLTFATDGPMAAGKGCESGLRLLGRASMLVQDGPLCESAVVTIPMQPGGDPLVIGLSGGIVVGEEVSQGAAARPLLLQATASLLVKHGNLIFRTVCLWAVLESLCDRFVANSVTLSPGDSVKADGHGGETRAAAGLGFVRIDPNEMESGMLFNLAAPATAFEVQRMQGETFTVRESLFDVIERSPVVKALNVILLALGLPWYFLRLKGGGPEEGKGRAAAVLVGMLLCAPGPLHAQQAMVRAGDTGQALLRSRGDRCYAVTPVHVLGGETSALVTAPGRERGEGDLLRRIPAAPEPIALISLRGIPLTVCPPFEGATSLDDLLRAHGAALLQLVRADGSIDRVPLALGTVEVETLEVHSDGGSLEQGMSGGTVLVADHPVGLLVDVSDEGHTGRVVRLDRVFERLAPHLATALPTQEAHALVGSVPYDIIRSTAAPVAPENKVASLQGDGQGPWRVPADGRVELVVKVNAPFSSVTLDLSGMDDPPQSLEVLGSRSERGPWQSLATFALEPGDTLQTRRLPSVRLGWVLIRATAPASRKTIAIRRLSFAPG